MRFHDSAVSKQLDLLRTRITLLEWQNGLDKFEQDVADMLHRLVQLERLRHRRSNESNAEQLRRRRGGSRAQRRPESLNAYADDGMCTRGTHTAKVDWWRAQFHEWVSSQMEAQPLPAAAAGIASLDAYSDQRGHILWRLWTVRDGRPKLVNLELDGRLDREYLLQTWGMTYWQACGQADALFKLRTLVNANLDCLNPPPQGSHPGPFFEQIDDAWIFAPVKADLSAEDYSRAMLRYQAERAAERAGLSSGGGGGSTDDDHGRRAGEPYAGCKESLQVLLRDAVNKKMQSDAVNLVLGLCSSPQPAGRYIIDHDLIRLWNQSAGRCQHCGRAIYLQWNTHNDTAAAHSDLHCPHVGCQMRKHLACLQRRDPNIIHLASNCECYICASCSGTLGVRRREHSVMGARHVLQAARSPAGPSAIA